MRDTFSSSRRGVFRGEVLVSERICAEHYRLILDVSDFPPTRPGQFVQLSCRPCEDVPGPRVVDWPEGAWPRATQPELADRQTILRRPLSLAGRRDRTGPSHQPRAEIDLIYRRVGTGTRWLAGVRAGQELSVLGPLGNAFEIRPDRPVAALVGGGVGIPPLLYLAETLTAGGTSVVAFVGARSAELLPVRLLPAGHVSSDGEPEPCVAELAACDVPAAVATDDGSLGFAGYVHQPFHRWLDASGLGRDELVVYSCGPEPMMKAVAELCIERGIDCQLALERHMACGMGTCQSCVVKIRDPDSPDGWSFKLCCTDGPVFDARDVLW